MSKSLAALVHVAAAVVVLAVLVAAGQPIFTDDLWWHLALGKSYAAQGPWLAQDPLLFTATHAPTPAAWLADVFLHGVQRSFGFTGLRIVHAALVAAIFALAWTLLRRASRSAVLASLGLAIFAVLSAFRVIQLRPHLFTLLGVLLLFQLLFSKPGVPSKLRIAATALLFAAWANLHNGFLLGPILLGAGLGGVLLGAVAGPRSARGEQKARAAALLAALAIGGLATFANPSGWEPHVAYFAAGEESPDLSVVGDEWAPFRAFQFPNTPLPPAPLDWVLIWGLLIATPAVALLLLRKGRDEQTPRVDFAWIALALVSLPAMLMAVRFAWLGIFPLLLFGAAIATRTNDALERAVPRLAALLASSAIVCAFFFFGAWRSVSAAIPRPLDQYLGNDYPAAKWFSHGVWFLKDSGVTGNVFNDYFMGGYLGFWLTPELKAFQNGTLNVPVSTHEAMVALRSRRGLDDGRDFETLLDAYEVDFVFGIRLPERMSGPWHYTTALMERAPGWLPVFRSVDLSISMRNDARNRANLERIARYYEDAGVPFDRETGFDPRLVLRDAPDWARTHGLVPIHFDSLATATQSSNTKTVLRASAELAMLYASLGVYDDALRQIDRQLTLEHDSKAALRLRLWTLMRLDRRDELSETLARAEKDAPPRTLLAALCDDARRYLATDDPEQAASAAALSRVLSQGEVRLIRSRMLVPEQRRN